ncbi:MAG: transcriptional regulator [Candidatus Eisenbacteria bacterium]|nr:transcriptional regulator [Candidatus Eisenbacteria bacterium]
MNPAQFLHTHRVFTRAELAAALDVPGRRSPGTLDSHLTRWGGDGRVRRLRRGLYVRLAADRRTAEPVDPYALAARLAPDAVLGYHTALELHGLAQSMFSRFFFVTRTNARPFRYEGGEYLPVRPRAGVGGAATQLVLVQREDGPVRVTSVERTLVDVLDRPELAGGTEEVWRSLEHLEALDFAALRDYFERVARPVLAARLGLMLEQHAERWFVPPALLADLARQRPRGPVSFDRRRHGCLVTRWNLVVPPDLLPGKEGEDGDA